ncbi:hypothetical protein MI149_29905 (plasmid) [Mycolicibacterium crocinum]|uniref:DUF222 domain-containing protein n=1 Tax=Mycolicibacterium crocinum TaxID=388459 RepID=A0ABY3TUT4_9MYCO|nr:hypothetical protein [Mycolicibacterium crocinum]ULN44711.1 hypothetical protein MI149_29905 [Mycolicibacterium crocinum]
MKITCHPDDVVWVINELHAVAEAVRTYGDLGRTGVDQPRLEGLPTQLYLLAAAVEAQMRALLHTDQLCASRLFRALPSLDDPPRSVMHFDLTAADTVVVSAVSTEICIAELSDAHQRLIAATKRLRTSLQSQAMAPLYESLDNEAEQLRLFVAAFA